MNNESVVRSKRQFPLEGLYVIDLCDQIGHSCGRYLADLGAEVILLEPISGLKSRKSPPLHNGCSLHFEVHHANKSSVVIDVDDPDSKDLFFRLLERADIVIDSGESSFWSAFGIILTDISKAWPELVCLSITDFGLQGPYKGYIADESIHLAMSTVLSRSGIKGDYPLLPPGELASESASVQASWVALLSYWQKLRTGKGDLLDFSINDATAQIFDPGVGATGSAAAGKTAIESAPRGRPEVDFVPGKMPSVALLYPIFQCVDGYVRACILNPRQWQGMSEWMGNEHPFTDKKYETAMHRVLEIDKVNQVIAEFFKDKTKERLVSEGQLRGVPIAALNRPGELFDNSHYQSRDFFTRVDVVDDDGLVPAGFLRIDQKRIGMRAPAPSMGQHNDAVTMKLGAEKTVSIKPLSNTEEVGSRPLDGLLILDLGVIVAGGDLGRLFADQGAEVIKIENQSFPDGLRQSIDNNPVPLSFSQANRNKKSLGLNLRTETGKRIFLELAAKADVVLSNFKPGTMENLGFGYDQLNKLNKRIICSESSAMGSVGPNSKTMGYGPLVRASTGLTGLWKYPEVPLGFADSVTIFPDHFVARVSATAILAKLIERQTTGVGGYIDVSQAECIVNAMAVGFLRESLEPGSLSARGNDLEFSAPGGVFQCAGDDEWCVISVKEDSQWQAMCTLMGRIELAEDKNYSTVEARLGNKNDVNKVVGQWCGTKGPCEVLSLCQSVGIPAGNMLRLSEFTDNPHFQARNFFRKLDQPSVGRIVDTENGPVGFAQNLPEPMIEAAPYLGEHSRELLARHLGYGLEKIEELIESGDVQVSW